MEKPKSDGDCKGCPLAAALEGFGSLEIGKLTPHPGDVIVIAMPEGARSSPDARDMVNRTVGRIFPASLGCRVLIVDHGTKLEVVRRSVLEAEASESIFEGGGGLPEQR